MTSQHREEDKERMITRIVKEETSAWGIPVDALLIVLTVYGLSLIGWVWVWAWIATTLVMGAVEVFL